MFRDKNDQQGYSANRANWSIEQSLYYYMQGRGRSLLKDINMSQGYLIFSVELN